MNEKELIQKRNAPQVVTNILDRDFDFTWDGIDYTLDKGETTTYAFYLAEHCAFHMARAYAIENDIDFNKKAGEIIDKIMKKKTIEYDKLTLKEAKELAKERKISLEDEKGKPKTKKVLIEELKDTH